MYFVYVIQSISDPSYYYKGHCKDLEVRVKQHNSGMTKSNKHKAPFKLIYSENFAELKSAIKREKYFKSAAGRVFLRNRIAQVD